MNIAIIPARGGSRRIPRKNIKDFCGKPMIAYAILAAKESGLFDRIVVSTDDEEITNIALAWGAQVPFLRPRDLADDFTATVPVIANAVQNCQRFDWVFENVCCIYPCVPLIQSQDIINSYNLLNNSKSDFCFPIAKNQSPPQRALRLLSNGKVQSFHQGFELARNQDLEKSYYDAGQFYWGCTKLWLTNSYIYKNALGYEIPSWRAVDIDNIEDWYRAELLYKGLNNLINY